MQLIVCIGEHLEEYKAGKSLEVVTKQMESIAKNVSNPADWQRINIAYEPIFCIGTGLAMDAKQAQEMHAAIRAWLREQVNAEVAATTRILYGGSVKPSNSDELAAQPDVDGFLVGGASLVAESFLDIVKSMARKS